MNRFKNIFFVLSFCINFVNCGTKPTKVNYGFTEGNFGDAKTFKVGVFQNYASQSPGSKFEPGMDRDFTLALQDRIQGQSNLTLVNNDSADLLYEGEIVEYLIVPMTATAHQNAAQNRLTIGVQVRFYNNTKEDADFDQRFSFFFDYPANQQLASVKTEAYDIIFERITQDIFNASLADW